MIVAFFVGLFVTGNLWGFTAYFTRAPIEKNIRNTEWQTLTKYAVGMELIFPVIAAFLWFVLRVLLGWDSRRAQQAVVALGVAYQAGCVSFGIGDAIGHALFPPRKAR